MSPYLKIFNCDSSFYYNFTEDKVYVDDVAIIPYEEYDTRKTMHADNYSVYQNASEGYIGQFAVIDNEKREIVGSYDMGETIYSTDIPRIYGDNLYLSYVVQKEDMFSGYSIEINLESGV